MNSDRDTRRYYERYIRHGTYRKPGAPSVRLLQSRNTGVFVADYWNGTKRVRRSIGTGDLDKAKEIVAAIHKNPRNGMPHKDTILYVIQRGADGPIKVGISKNVESRLSDLQTGNAERLRLLRIYEMRDVEAMVIAKLEKRRLEGEWLPAECVEDIDRILNVSFDVALSRYRKHQARKTGT
jgi:hypothetical protein